MASPQKEQPLFVNFVCSHHKSRIEMRCIFDGCAYIRTSEQLQCMQQAKRTLTNASHMQQPVDQHIGQFFQRKGQLLLIERFNNADEVPWVFKMGTLKTK